MKWLEREMVVGPYLGLATCEADFHKAMRHLKVSREKWNPWLAEDSHGCMHALKNPAGSIVCLVCIRVGAQEPMEAAATLIHEAVHVWQTWCDYRGERAPSAEFEAYSIENIAKRLMEAYAKALEHKKKELLATSAATR